jgi:hypothetical protein
VEAPAPVPGPVRCPGRPVDDRGWGPTILLCLAVLVTAVIVVVAKPLTAGASVRSHPRAARFRSGDAGLTRGTRTVSAVTPVDATSPNWSGYVAYADDTNDGSFNQVSADWIEPAVSCPKKNAWTLFWVGFDGWPASDRSVEQGGTSAQCVNGVPRYSAFYEMWPSDAVTSMPDFPVHPGDQIDASVVYDTTTQQFLITVDDVTTNQSLTESLLCPTVGSCARSSAEWIAESPSHFGTDSWFPLANYGTVQFTQATATNAASVQGPISFAPTWSASGIERVAGATKPLATVYDLQNSGTTSSFYDKWRRR